VKNGDVVIYTITAYNDGPDDVIGATVTDTFPGGPESCSWTCAAAGAAACGQAGPVSGHLADSPDLPAGDSVTYTAVCTVVATSGSLLNVATIAAPSSVADPIAGNDAAEDATEVTSCGEADELVLSAQTVTDEQTFEACQTLTAHSDFVIAATGDVTLRAGISVVLGAGFAVEVGGRLVVSVGPTLPAE
jgi:uncharacterized repeat protein (TIGR01451 family)